MISWPASLSRYAYAFDLNGMKSLRKNSSVRSLRKYIIHFTHPERAPINMFFHPRKEESRWVKKREELIYDRNAKKIRIEKSSMKRSSVEERG
jgi:hypothetical protein